MICPVCWWNRLKATVFGGAGITMPIGCHPYWDEEGIYHSHDGSIRSSYYHCSNGHKWKVSYVRGCSAPDCEFRGEETYSFDEVHVFKEGEYRGECGHIHQLRQGETLIDGQVPCSVEIRKNRFGSGTTRSYLAVELPCKEAAA